MDAVARIICAEGIAEHQVFVKFYRIKCSIAKKSFQVDQWVCLEKILEGGNEKPCIVDGFIFIRRIGFFLNGDFRMLLEKVLIIEDKMADNSQFVGITKMPINVKLFVWELVAAWEGMGGHGSVSCFVGVVVIIKAHGFCIGFEMSDDAVGIFGVVFGDLGFDSGRIENSHIRFGRVDCLTDWFRKVNQLFKNNTVGRIRKENYRREILYRGLSFYPGTVSQSSRRAHHYPGYVAFGYERWRL